MARRGRPPGRQVDDVPDDDQDDGTGEPERRRPTFHAGHPLSLESSGRRSVQAVMAAAMAESPEDAVNLREAFLEWIAGDFKSDLPSPLARVLESALAEGLTRHEVESLLAVRGWLGEGAAIPLGTWNRMRAAINADAARAAVLLEETSAGPLRRVAYISAAFEAAVEDAIHGPEILRGEARSGVISLGSLLAVHQAELERRADAGAAPTPEVGAEVLPTASESPLAVLREAWAAMKVRRSKESVDAAPAGE